MMDYGLFKKLIAQRIKDYMPPVFQNYRPEIREVVKVNQKKDGFMLMPPENASDVAVPTLYLDDIYMDFCEDQDLDRVLRQIADVLICCSGVSAPQLAEFVPEKHTDRIVANLIGAVRNRSLLEKVPHTDLLDLAVVYRLVQSVTEDGINSALITNEMLRDTGLDTQTLHQLALENTPRLFPARILPTSGGLYIMTNESSFFGATTMLYKDDMARLRNLVGEDFFVIPTSMHEFFAVPSSQADIRDLTELLRAGNGTVTDEPDILSSSVYLYSGDAGQVVLEQ